MTTYGMDGARIQDAQRISDQQREIEAAAVREVELRGAYQRNFGMILAAFGIDDDSQVLPADTGDKAESAFAINHNLVLLVKRRMDTTLADPSPIEAAAGALIEAAVLERVKTIEFVDALHASGLKDMDEDEGLLGLCRISNAASLERAKAADAYRALRDGHADGGG